MNSDNNKKDSDILGTTKKKKEKCPICNKKLSLLDIVCKCGIKHCRQHCLPEYHNCIYDLSSEKNSQLENNLIIINNDRIETRI